MTANAECISSLQVEEQLFDEPKPILERVQAILFPGVQLSTQNAPLLAARLHELATDVESNFGVAESRPVEAQSSDGDVAGAFVAAVGPPSTSGCSVEPEPPAKKRKGKRPPGQSYDICTVLYKLSGAVLQSRRRLTLRGTRSALSP